MKIHQGKNWEKIIHSSFKYEILFINHFQFYFYQVLLKNILTAIIRLRKHCRMTGNGAFFFDMGTMFKDPYTRNTVTRQITDDEPFEVDKEIASTNIIRRVNDSIFLAACEDVHQQPANSRINLLDLYKALQDRNVIPCHSVYSNSIERISQMLN